MSTIDPELDEVLSKWAKVPGPDMDEELENVTTFHMWRWQLEEFRAGLCRLVDSHFAPQWLYVGFETEHSYLVFTTLRVTTRGKRRYTGRFDALLKQWLRTGEIPV